MSVTLDVCLSLSCSHCWAGGRYKNVTSGDEAALQEAVASGVVSVGIDAGHAGALSVP